MPTLLKRTLLTVAVVALAAAGTVGTASVWTAIGGGPLSVHGWIAMAIGIGGSIALAWGLMTLAFRSDRDGWDAQADRLPADDAAASRAAHPPEA
ncbi:hypothetical protein [uncultured Brevundimonas sp.]|uniref:hypothetical protein n=1 Tax=uncultured Brevundimonas sp. TaxID=213418 RepID=UPI0030EEE108|tara:strand:+ start:335 stop:619 length:285 start_codon:yes stop_codon:yes gene_type:complete